jgi:hypothetical protein
MKSAVGQIRRPPREWATTLRVEKRRGITRYVVTFSDGRTRASLFGTLKPFTNSSADLKQEAWETALNWLAHVQPVSRRPRREYQRVHFPVNRQRRKHHGFGRRAAA